MRCFGKLCVLSAIFVLLTFGPGSAALADASPERTLLGPASAAPTPVVGEQPVDLDGDGVADVIFANLDQRDQVCFGDGAGGFASCADLSPEVSATVEVALGDVDGDGDLDAFLVNLDDTSPVCLNDGAGRFTCAPLGAESGDAVALGDVDGDGDLDAVLAVFKARDRVCRNNGHGVFRCADLAPEALGSDDVALGDVDGDGDLDAMVANRNGTDRLCVNHGGGVFRCHELSGERLATVALALGDLDGDGDLDAVLANLSQSNRVCSNDGRGVFSCGALSRELFDHQELALGDVDLDGDLDVVIATLDHGARLCLNDGGGAFGCADLGSPARSTRGVALADLDGDGDLDVLFAEDGAANQVCLNDGSIGFICGDIGVDTLASFGVVSTTGSRPGSWPAEPTERGSWPSAPGGRAQARADKATCTTPDTTPPVLTLPSLPPVWQVELLAGAGMGRGSIDGIGDTARFHYPYGVAVDGSGNVYVADNQNHTLRKITPTGRVSTLAGTPGAQGSTNGTGSAARFRSPGGVAVDASGNVYVADTYNHVVRKVTADGVVTTLAGSPGSTGSADGIGSAARFNYPMDVEVDGSGNVYVVDSSNQTIRKISPAGEVTTFAGTAGATGSTNGLGGNARFYYPTGIGIDTAGTLLIADRANQTIRKISPAGEVTTLVGTPGAIGSADGTGAAARFYYPWDVAVDASGTAYVVDSSNLTIRKVSPGGVVTTLAGAVGVSGGADGLGAAAHFYDPQGIAADAGGTVYVADTRNHNIRKISPAGGVTTLAGPAGAADAVDGSGAAARFFLPSGVASDSSGNLYVADTGNHTLRKITSAGEVDTVVGMAGVAGSSDGTVGVARLRNPQGVAVDGAGNLYIADRGNHTIRKVTPAGVVSTLAGWPGSRGGSDGTGSAARFDNPYGVAVDTSGNVYVADTVNHTIRKITPGGVVTTLAGSRGATGSSDGLGSAARFFYPSSVAVDPLGNLYVADTYNFTLRKITPVGEVTTLAGQAGQVGSTDASGNAARFYFPYGVAVDADGTVYVADAYNQTIRQVSATGMVITLAGAPVAWGSLDGQGATARFDNPTAVAVDASGTLYIADTNNHSIRRITRTLQPVTDYSAQADASCRAALFDLSAEVMASDECGPPTLSQDPVAGTLLGVGPHTVRVLASDMAGNTSFVDLGFEVVDPTGDTCVGDPTQAGHGGLDEGSGSTIDFGNGNIGSLNGGVTWTGGQQGSGLEFDGGGYVEVVDSGASVFDLTDGLTLALWVRPDALGGTQVLISKDGAYELELGKLGTAVWDLRVNNGVEGTATLGLTEGVWQHLAVTWDGSTVRYYRNGQPDGTDPFAGPINTNNENLGIGARPAAPANGGPVFHFVGAIDDVRVHSRALSDAEIADLFATTVSDITPPQRSNPMPDRVVATAPVAVGLTTDEAADCRYGETAGLRYADLPSPFALTGGTGHSSSLSPAGPISQLRVRCRDRLGNVNSSDFLIGIGIGTSDLVTGRVAAWTFEEASDCQSGDASGNGHSAALGPDCAGTANAPQWTGGAQGGALHFDGVDDRVTIASAAPFQTPAALGLSAWVRSPTSYIYRAIVDARDAASDGYTLYISDGSKAFLRINGNTVLGSKTVADGQWHHLVGVYDGSSLRLYVDGMPDGSSAGSTAINVAAPLQLGHHFQAGGTFNLDGRLDTVMVYDRSLSDIEVFDLFLEGRP